MKPDRLERMFCVIGDAPEAIAGLRKLVVALAISDKLGDSADEGPSPQGLMERIDERKQELVRIGQLQKGQATPPVTQEELPDGLPLSARIVRLRAVANIEKGPTGIAKAKPGPYPLVVTAEQRAACDHFDFDGAAAIVPLVSSTGHGKASLHRLHYQEGRFALGSILAAIFPYAPELLSARFIFEYLSAFKEELLVSRMIGTANVSLSIGKVGDVPVPLIGPSAQARVDELMALCDRLEAARTERENRRDRLVAANLHRLSQPADEDGDGTFRADARFYLNHLPRLTTRAGHVKQLRQTILNLAVRGRLVPQDPKDEPASELLGRIAPHGRQGKRGGRAIGFRPLAPLDTSDAPFRLPRGWTWARFPEVGIFGRGKSKHRPRNDPALYTGGAYPFIQTGDVARSRGLIKSFSACYNDVGLAQSAIWPAGTLCITIAANIADSGILTFDACFPDSVVGLIPAKEFSGPKYFEYFLRTAKADLLEFAPSTAQKNINLGILSEVLIPLPPLPEQHRIVAKVDELMALCDRLEAGLGRTEADSRGLLEAVLHEALQPAESALEAAD